MDLYLYLSLVFGFGGNHEDHHSSLYLGLLWYKSSSEYTVRVTVTLCYGKVLYLSVRWVSNQSSKESNIWHDIEIRHWSPRVAGINVGVPPTRLWESSIPSMSQFLLQTSPCRRSYHPPISLSLHDSWRTSPRQVNDIEFICLSLTLAFCRIASSGHYWKTQ